MHATETEARIDRVLDAAYDSAVQPEHWPLVLEGLTGLFRSHFADLYARTTDLAQYRGTAIGLDERDYQELFLDTWVKRNIWGKHRPVRVAGEVLSTRQMVPKAELVRSEMYNEYLAPRGLHEGMRVSLWAGDGWVQYISLLRPWSAGPFEEAELRLARRLLPHLQRAASVSRRVRAAVATGQAAVDAMPQAAFLLDAQGRLQHANRLAEALATEGDGILLAADATLRASEPRAGRELAAALARGAGLRGRRMSGSVTLPRPSGRGTLTASIVPVREEADWTALRLPALLVLVAGPPEAPSAPSAREIKARFGLTEAEAELALDLAEGGRLADIAVRRGRSVNTLRTHLARLMAKTGTHRQSDLVRLLLAVDPKLS